MSDTKMSKTKNLPERFAEITRNYETGRQLQDMGECLNHPMLLVYVGEGDAEMHPEMVKRLSNLWPQSRKDFRFLSLKQETNAPVYRSLSLTGELSEPLSDDAVMEILDEIQGSGTRYPDFSKVCIYYLIHTGTFENASEMNTCFSLCEGFYTMLHMRNAEEFFEIFLDERTSRKEISRGIRSVLFETQHALGAHSRNIFLVSNLLKNQARLLDFSRGYDAFTDFIALSNRASEYENPLSLPGVKTVGITRQEKPIGDIGRAVVLAMIEYLKSMEKERHFELTPGKLGIRENGTLEIFEKYAEEKVPKEADLDVFPRPDADYFEMETLSYAEFNTQTMGAWDAMVGNMVKAVKDEITKAADFSDAWRNQYRTLLRRNLKTDEAAELLRYDAEIRGFLTRAKEPGEKGLVLNVAVEKVGYLLAMDPKVREMMLSEIEAYAREAAEFRKVWDDLYERRYEFNVENEYGVAEFYRAKVRHLCETKGIEERFFDLLTPEALFDYFDDCFREFIEAEPVFRASFDEELATRMEEAGDAKDSGDYIRERLTHSGTTQFLTTTLPLSAPVMSSVFVKRGSDLYHNLRKNLPDDFGYSYYNTGISGYAEAIYIYDVPADFLLN